MEKVRWRGTWGIGDSMNALNVCHNYCFTNKTKVNLEMHWHHGENHYHHPKDPETIVQRTDWIHSHYHRQDDVTLTHVFNSDLFPQGNRNPDEDKHRFYFDSGKYEPTGAPPNDWIFKQESFVEKRKKIVIWTPTFNTMPPRTWKRFLTNDDWSGIIKLLSWEGWITCELTYRQSIRDAFKQISEADFIVCYDGMWHYIARNFGKPMFVPSWEGITRYNTPQAVTRPLINIRNYPDAESAIRQGRKEVKEFFGSGNDDFTPNLTEMKSKSREYLHRLKKYYED